jgi:hypothetical protein
MFNLRLAVKSTSLELIKTAAGKRSECSNCRRARSPGYSTFYGILVATDCIVPMRLRTRRAILMRDQLPAIARRRIGRSTNSANPTTAKFMIVVSRKTICQLPVASLIMLAMGTRKAEVPFAV